MKKLVSILLAVSLMAVSLVSLGEAAPVSVTLWHSMTGEAGLVMDRLIASFNETVGKEKGILATAVFQGAYADATQKMQAVLNAGNAASLPDVMQMDATGKVGYASSGFAFTVDDALKTDPSYDLGALNPSALGNWNYLGRQLGVPFATSTTVTYYNKTMLDQAGIPVPLTFEEVAAAARRLPKEDENGQPVYVLGGLPNTPTLANWLSQMGSYLVDQENGSAARAYKLDCVDNGALEGFLTEWKAMYDAGALLNSSAGLTDLFAAGQIALLITSSSNTKELLNMTGGRFELGVSSYLKVNQDCREGASPSGSGLFMFDRGDGKTDAAWELVKYLVSAPAQAELACGTGYIPSNQGAAREPRYVELIAQNPIYEAPMRQLNATPGDMVSVTVGPSADFYYAIQNQVSDMLELEQTPGETVELMAQELNGLLDEYNRANPA